MEGIILLGLLAIIVIFTRGADATWRKDNGIQPMSKEDERNNAELARRRRK